MPITSSITSDSFECAGQFGMKKSRVTCATGGWIATSTGTSSRLSRHNPIANRSKRLKSPVLTAAMVSAAATHTPATFGSPKKSRTNVMPMNSVTIVSALSRNRSITLNAPQNLPKRSKIRRAWPTPVTAPRRSTISWFTYSTGTSSSSVHSSVVP